MRSLYVELIGDVAGFLTTVSFVPQVVKVVRDHDTAAISLPMYVAFITGVALWMLYGAWLHSYSIVIANAITLLLASTVLGLKLYLERC